MIMSFNSIYVPDDLTMRLTKCVDDMCSAVDTKDTMDSLVNIRTAIRSSLSLLNNELGRLYGVESSYAENDCNNPAITGMEPGEEYQMFDEYEDLYLTSIHKLENALYKCEGKLISIIDEEEITYYIKKFLDSIDSKEV